jgi:uncharacterized membrane protein
MVILLRALRLLAVVTWVGGLIFFAFVVAPVAFNLAYTHVLPSTHAAGMVVAGTLQLLNRLGHVSGVFFLLVSLPLWFRTTPRGRRLLLSEMGLVLAMIAATMYVQSSIIPAMERDRLAAGGDIDAAPPDDPARLDFERLHPISEKVEGAALFLGLAVVVLIAAEPGDRPRA